MKKTLRILFAAIACFCVATVIAQLVGLGCLISQGAVTRDRVYQMLAVVQGVDLEAMVAKLGEQNRPVDEEQVSYEQILRKRALEGFDLDLRENAYDRGMKELLVLNTNVKEEVTQFENRRNGFKAELDKLSAGVRDTAIQDLQQMIESMSPIQAKDQILLILEEPAVGRDDPMNDVLTVLKQMPPTKQKKLFAEFEKDEQDAKQLHELLDQIRRGAPEAALIEEARDDAGRDAT